MVATVGSVHNQEGGVMTERDLTANNGVIAKELDGTGWYWERMPEGEE